jgi:hypothetical protein
MCKTLIYWFMYSIAEMQPRQKKKVFLYAGIGFVVLGIVSIVLIYMFVY